MSQVFFSSQSAATGRHDVQRCAAA